MKLLMLFILELRQTLIKMHLTDVDHRLPYTKALFSSAVSSDSITLLVLAIRTAYHDWETDYTNWSSISDVPVFDISHCIVTFDKASSWTSRLMLSYKL